MKKLLILFISLFFLFASSIIYAGQDEAKEGCKNLLTSVKSKPPIFILDTDIEVHTVSATLVNGKFVDGPLYGVQIRGTSSSDDVSFLCVTATTGEVLKVIKPIFETAIDMELYRAANEKLGVNK